MTVRLTRRGFVQAAGAAVLASACGDDEARRPDTAPDIGGDLPDVADTSIATAPDTADTSATTDSAPAETDAAPDVDADADTGPHPIGVFDPSQASEDEDAFRFGVQAGDPDRNGAILWTHFAAAGGGSPGLEVVVFEDGAEGATGDLYLRQAVTPSDSGFVHVEVTGLAPDARYRYAFVVVPAGGDAPSARSRVGRFRTAPAERTLRVVTFGGVSCVNQSYRPYRTLTRAAEGDLDFFLLTGDAAYMDGALSLADYRELWRQAYDTDGYRALFAACGIYGTWDDHEVYDNWDPERVAPDILAAAKTAYLEHSALRLDPRASGWKIWRSQRWGRTVEVFVLDCRSERKPSTRMSADATYLSRAQMDWLKKGLHDSPCVFKIIANTVPITDMPVTYPQDKDRWEGYPAQRDEILGLTKSIPGVLWLSGDFHFGAVCSVDPPGGRFEAQWEVFMGQGANMPNPVWPALADIQPQFAFVTGTNNYVRFVCDPIADPPTLTATFIDGDGAELYTQAFQLGAQKPEEP
ncbi:MAG: alkaline phosphatase D family protein [Myxococcota bacterium]